MSLTLSPFVGPCPAYGGLFFFALWESATSSPGLLLHSEPWKGAASLDRLALEVPMGAPVEEAQKEFFKKAEVSPRGASFFDGYSLALRLLRVSTR